MCARVVCLWFAVVLPFKTMVHQTHSKTTIIFVDVDGVLNVAVADPGKSNLSLDPKNVMMALKTMRKTTACKSAQRIVAAYYHDLDHGEAGSFGIFSNEDGIAVCNEFARRLAGLMRIAGDCIVVLSSSWRVPKYDTMVERLEFMVSQHVGVPFHFADRTALVPEHGPGDRISNIGDYLSDFCEREHVTHVKALVLDDLFVTPMGGWQCGGVEMESASCVENYLKGRVSASMKLEVGMICVSICVRGLV